MIGTATGEDISYLQSIGVDDVVDYKTERFEEKVKSVDAVVDLVGGDTLARSYAVAKSGGVVASTVQPIDKAAAERAGVRGVHVVMKRNAKDLVELAGMVERGAVKPRMGDTLGLDQAKEAQELSSNGQSRGKVILKVA